MVNKNSTAYRIGRVVGRVGLIVVGFLFGKRWGRRLIDSFPEK